MLQNLHTHTHFSDGSAAPHHYLESAKALGLTSLGFSDHSPLPFENTFALRPEKLPEYCQTIQNLQNFATSLPHDFATSPPRYFATFLGLEADFIPSTGHPFSYFREHFPLDYLIGSVHLVRNGSPDDLWFIDGPDPATYTGGLDRLFGGDIRKGVTAYYRQVCKMLETDPPDVIGHLDKIKMHNGGKFFSESDPWYIGLVEETLALVKEKGVIAEVNTRGIYKKRCPDTFPGPWVLKRMHTLGIPVIITSDAHKPEEVANLFAETAELLRGIGYGGTMYLTEGGWIENSLGN